MPPAQGDMIQWLNETTDGLTVDDNLSILTVPTLSDVNALSFDGIDDNVDFGYIGNYLKSITIRFYNDAVISKSSTAASLIGFTNQEIGAIRLGPSTTFVTDEILSIGSTSGVTHTRCAWVGDDEIAVGWHDLIVAWDGAKYTFTLDGDLKTTTTYGTPLLIDLDNVVLGSTSLSSYYFPGDISELSIENTDDQIVLHSPLSEGQGTTAGDVSGKGNDGTISGATWVQVDGIPSWNAKEGFLYDYMGRTRNHITGVPTGNFVKIGSTSYVDLDAALAAAVSGDTIKLGSGTYSPTSQEVPVGVSIEGTLAPTFDTVGTFIDDALMLTGNSSLRNLSITATGNAVVTTIGDNNTIENCYIDGADQADHGILMLGSNSNVTNSTIVDSEYHSIAVKGYGHVVEQNSISSSPLNAVIIKADISQSDNNTTHDIIVRSNTISGRNGDTASNAFFVEAFDDGSQIWDVTINNNVATGYSTESRMGFFFRQKASTNASITAYTAFNNNSSNMTWLVYTYGVDATSVVTADLGDVYRTNGNTGDDGNGTYTITFTLKSTSTNLIGYIPALPFKSKSIATFDGIGDYVRADGIDGINGYPFRLRGCYKYTDNAGINLAAVSLTDSTVENKQFDIGQSLGKIQLIARNTTPISLVTPLSYNDGALYCVEGRFNSATEREIWVGTSWDSLEKVAGGGGLTSVPFFTPNSFSVGANTDASPGQFWAGGISEATAYSGAGVTKVVDYDFTGMLGKATSTILDLSGNGNNGTVSTGAGGLESFWAHRQEDTSGVLVASDYNPVTNFGGYVHNLSEVINHQTDAGFVGEIQDADAASVLAHINGVDSLWIQFRCINGVYHINKNGWVKYDASYSPTPSEYSRLVLWSNRFCDAPGGHLVPAEVTPGTGIGPGGAWADNGEGRVLLVEDI